MAEEFTPLVLEGKLSPELEMSGEMAFSIIDNRSIASYDEAGAVRPSKETFTLDERDGLLDLTREYKTGLNNLKGAFSPIIQANDICKVWDETKLYKKGELCFYSVFEKEFFPTTEKRYTTVYRAIRDNIGVNPEFLPNDYWEPFVKYLNENMSFNSAEGTELDLITGKGGIRLNKIDGQTVKADGEMHNVGEPINLLNPTLATTTSYGVTCTNNGNGTYTLNGTNTSQAYIFTLGTIYLEKGKTYKLVGCPSNGSDSTYYLQLRTPTNANFINDYGNGEIANITESGNYIVRIFFGISSFNNLVFKPMLSTDLSVSYNEFAPSGSVVQFRESNNTESKTINLPLSAPLRSIGDIKDELIVNADGTGKIVRRIMGVTFNQISGHIGYANNYFYISGLLKAIGNTNVLSNVYDVVDVVSTNDLLNGQMKGHVANTNVYFKDNRATTKAEILTFIGNDEFLYELATPTEEILTAEQLKAIFSLASFKDNTTLTTADGLAKMYIDYGKDEATATIIENGNKSNVQREQDTSLISDKWSNTKTYAQGEYCISNNSLWKSKVNNNLGNVPSESSYWTASSVAGELTNLVKKISIKITTDTNGAVVSPISTDNIILSIVPHYNLAYATPYFRTAGLYGFFVATSSDNSRLKNTVVDIDIYYI